VDFEFTSGLDFRQTKTAIEMVSPATSVKPARRGLQTCVRTSLVVHLHLQLLHKPGDLLAERAKILN
jgi:hypothetical protein